MNEWAREDGRREVAFYRALAGRALDMIVPCVASRIDPERRHRITVVHGDAYLANVLVPRAGGGPIYLVDWQSPQAGIGAYDLVLLLAAFWTGEQRAENGRERALIDLYASRLRDHGVCADMNEILDDYRLMILVFLQVAVADFANGSTLTYWWTKIQCLERAARDYDGCDLLR
jgi:hypothetical protein